MSSWCEQLHRIHSKRFPQEYFPSCPRKRFETRKCPLLSPCLPRTPSSPPSPLFTAISVFSVCRMHKQPAVLTRVIDAYFISCYLFTQLIQVNLNLNQALS